MPLSLEGLQVASEPECRRLELASTRTYTLNTLREYRKRLRAEITHHSETLENLMRLDRRYANQELKLISRNESLLMDQASKEPLKHKV